MATERSYPMCSEIQDGSEVSEPTKVEIVALFEKATPENTKNATEYGVKILNGKLTKMKKTFK